MTHQSKQEPFRPTDSRRHLIPALYSWLLENDPAVHAYVLADYHGLTGTGLELFQPFRQRGNVNVVRADGSSYMLMREDVLQLDLSPQACRSIQFTQDYLWVEMRVNRKPVEISIPYNAIMAMFIPKPEKVNACSAPFPFFEDDLLDNGRLTAETLPEGVVALRPPKKQEQAAGAETSPPSDQTSAQDFSIKTEKKRPSHLTLVK